MKGMPFNMEFRRALEAKLKRGREIYEKILPGIIDEHKGKVVGILVESNRAFIGQSETEAYEHAEKEFPNCELVFFRVGTPYLHVIG